MTDDSQSTGFEIVVDESVPPDTVILEDPKTGKELARITNVCFDKLNPCWAHERESEEILQARLSNQQWSNE